MFANNFTVITFIVCLVLTLTQTFAEEYLFGGFLMQSFGSWFKIPVIAIILQSVLFILAHQQYDAVGLVAVFAAAFVYGIVTQYTKGLEASSAMHFANNYSIIFASALTLETLEIAPSVMDVVITIALLLITMAIIIFMDYRFNWFGLKK